MKEKYDFLIFPRNLNHVFMNVQKRATIPIAESTKCSWQNASV